MYNQNLTNVNFCDLITQQELEFLGVGMPDIQKKPKIPTDEELVITRIKIRDETKTHHIPVSLDLDIHYFDIPIKLKRFLESKGVKNLNDFISSYKKILKKVQGKLGLYMENFYTEIKNITERYHPTNSLKIIRQVKISRNVDYRTITLQQGFVYALHFFNKLFKISREFRRSVNEKAMELKLSLFPIYNYV